jgi:hypothetical protein
LKVTRSFFAIPSYEGVRLESKEEAPVRREALLASDPLRVLNLEPIGFRGQSKLLKLFSANPLYRKQRVLEER